MKFFHLLCSVFTITFFSTVSFAQQASSVIPSIKVYPTETNTLTLQNFSNVEVTVNIYGELLVLAPASGSQFNCQSYDDIAIELLGIEHDFFEVDCNSRVVIEASFMPQY